MVERNFKLIPGGGLGTNETLEHLYPFGGGPEAVRTPAEIRERNRVWPRLLRSYQRIAYTFHHCDACCFQIEPGSYYEGRVEVRPDKQRYRILVMKKHLEPKCPLNPFDDELFVQEREQEGVDGPSASDAFVA